MTKKTTIEDLARMMTKGFDQTATKKQMENVILRLDKIEVRVAKIDAILLADHKLRLEKLEQKVGDLEDQMRVR